MRLSFVPLLATIMLLAACAGGPPPVQPPVPAAVKAKGSAAVRSALLDETNHMLVHLDDEREVIYVQSFGNSLAVGALFGPLGVLANISATKAVTEADQARMKGKITASASKAFKAAAQETGLPLASQRVEGGVNFSPYLYLVKQSDGKVLLASALLVEAPTPGALLSQARYLYQLPLGYTVEELEKTTPVMVEEINRQLQAGYVEMIRFYQNDRSEAVNEEKLVKYKSDFLSPRFDFEAGGKIAAETADRVWIRYAIGVAVILRPNIKVLGPWE